MEKGVVPGAHEKLRSFDPLASVDMFRFDLQRFGKILPETERRVYDEELSNLSEAVDRAARTEFVLTRNNEELVYFDRGEWRPYLSTLTTGLRVAEAEAEADPRRNFLADRAAFDLYMGYQMQELRNGQQIAWHSPYPYRQAELYGEEFIQKRGFKPDRKMGFLYIAQCNNQGNVVLQSQTVDSIDQTDEAAFSFALEATAYDDSYDMDTLRRRYDGFMTRKYGEKFYAGRRGRGFEENAWEAIQQHRHLVTYLFDGLKQIAALEVGRAELELAAKEHVYGTWALFSESLKGVTKVYSSPGGGYSFHDIHRQANQSMDRFIAMRKPMIGCGGSIEMMMNTDDVMNADPADVFSAITGSSNSSNEGTSYSFNKYMYCVGCQAPPGEEETKKMCGPCGFCRDCDKQLRKESADA